MGDENPIHTLGDYSKHSHEGYRNTIELPKGNNVVPLRSDTIYMDSFQGLTLKRPSSWCRSLAPKEQTLYDNESWNEPRDFAKPVKAIYLPQDVPSTSDCLLVELENHVQRLMEYHLAPKKPVQVNKITSLCEIRSCPHDIQYCMENPEQAFVEYASSRTDEAGDPQCSTQTYSLINTITVSPKKPNKSRDDKSEEEGREEEGNPKNINTTPPSPPDPSISFITEKMMRIKLDPKEDPNRGVSNFTGRIKGIHVFIGNFTYVIDFMIVEDISSIVDPSYDKINEISYKMPHKIEQHDSLSDLEKEHTKLVYLRSVEDKRRGVEYVMSKILGFYKECLGLRHEYMTGVVDEGGVMKFFKKTKAKFSQCVETTSGFAPDGVAPPNLLYLMRRSLEVPRKFLDDDSWRTI
ncbi:hypothetical protein Tco_1201008 [Tanacetum coccineum]